MSKVTAHAQTLRHMHLVEKLAKGPLSERELAALEEYEREHKRKKGEGVGDGVSDVRETIEDVGAFIDATRAKLMEGITEALEAWREECREGSGRRAKPLSTTALHGFRMLAALDPRFSEKKESTLRLQDDTRVPLNELLDGVPLKDKKKLLEAMEELEANGQEEG